MSNKIEPQYEIQDGEEMAIWRIYKKDGKLLIDLDKALNEDIFECYWIDESMQFMIVEYYDWDTNELIALVNWNGQIIRKGISSIENYIEKYNLFIISIKGLGLGDEAIAYDMEFDDTRMAIINQYGDFYIDPIYDGLEYFEDEDILYAVRYHGELKHRFRINGQLPVML